MLAHDHPMSEDANKVFSTKRGGAGTGLASAIKLKRQNHKRGHSATSTTTNEQSHTSPSKSVWRERRESFGSKLRKSKHQSTYRTPLPPPPAIPLPALPPMTKAHSIHVASRSAKSPSASSVKASTHSPAHSMNAATGYFASAHTSQSTLAALASPQATLRDEDVLTPPAPAFLGRTRRHAPSRSDESAVSNHDSVSRLSLDSGPTITPPDRRSADEVSNHSLTSTALNSPATPADAVSPQHERTLSKKSSFSFRDVFKRIGRRWSSKGENDQPEAVASPVRTKPLFLVDVPPSPFAGPKSASSAPQPQVFLTLNDTDPFRHEPPASAIGSRKSVAQQSWGSSLSSALFPSAASPSLTASTSVSPHLSPLLLPSLAASRSIQNEQTPTPTTAITEEEAYKLAIGSSMGNRSRFSCQLYDTPLAHGSPASSDDDYGADTVVHSDRRPTSASPAQMKRTSKASAFSRPASAGTSRSSSPMLDRRAPDVGTPGRKALQSCTMLKLTPLLANSTPSGPSTARPMRASNRPHGHSSSPLRILLARSRLLHDLDHGARSGRKDYELIGLVGRYDTDATTASHRAAELLTREATSAALLETWPKSGARSSLNEGMVMWMARLPYQERTLCYSADGERGPLRLRTGIRPQSLAFSQRCEALAKDPIRANVSGDSIPPTKRADPPTISITDEQEIHKKPAVLPAFRGRAADPLRNSVLSQAGASPHRGSVVSSQGSSRYTTLEWVAEDDDDASDEDVPLAMLSVRRSFASNGRASSEPGFSRPMPSYTAPGQAQAKKPTVQESMLARQVQHQREARLKELEINKKLLAEARARRQRGQHPTVPYASAAHDSPRSSSPATRTVGGSPTNEQRKARACPTSFKGAHLDLSAPLPGSKPQTSPRSPHHRYSVPTSPLPSPTPSPSRSTRPSSVIVQPVGPREERGARTHTRASQSLYAGQEVFDARPSATAMSGMQLPMLLTQHHPQATMQPTAYGWGPMPMATPYYGVAPMYAGVPAWPAYGMQYFPAPAMPSIPVMQDGTDGQVKSYGYGKRPSFDPHLRSTPGKLPSGGGHRQPVSRRPILPYSSHSSPDVSLSTTASSSSSYMAPSSSSFSTVRSTSSPMQSPRKSPTSQAHPPRSVSANGNLTSSQPIRRSPLAQHVYRA